MSSSAVSQCVNVSVLRKLLAAEKESTRGWLRAEMDRLVDPMLDSIFSRLETKLKNGLERSQSGGGRDQQQIVNSSFVDQSWNVSQAGSLIGQSSPSTSLSSSLIPPLSHFTPHHVNLNNYHPILFNPHSSGLSPVPPQPVSITNVQSRPMLIVHGATATEPMYEDHFPHSLSAPILNEQSNDNLANCEEEDEEECDCDECVYGIVITDEDDVGDGVQWIEDDHELCPPAKKPRTDQTQPNNAQVEVNGESSTQPNQLNKQFTTVHLQCPYSNCPDTFSEDQLNRHMLAKHEIGPNRCLVKDCAQWFNNNNILGDHIKQAHHHTTQWHCSKCPKYYSTYRLLSCHNTKYHQLGLFHCSFLACTFTGECKDKMHKHYTQQHKQTLTCPHPGCLFKTTKVSDLKRHQRIHLGNKPYRCKWPNCDYAGTQKVQVISHICVKHQAPNPGSDPNGAQFDPQDYVEVVNDLPTVSL